MADILRKQILIERNKLADPRNRADEKWLTELIGESAVSAIKVEAARRTDAELRRKGIVVLPCPHQPKDEELGLSEEGMAYWNAVRQAKTSEPELKRFEPSWAAKRIRKIKLRMPKRLLFIAGHVLFEPKLTKRESFIGSLHTVVDAYLRLPNSDQAKFTTDYAPEIGGLRFPHPAALARWAKAMEAYQIASKASAAVRLEATRQAWVAGLDKAAGRNTGFYKVGGRLGVVKEGNDEQSN